MPDQVLETISRMKWHGHPVPGDLGLSSGPKSAIYLFVFMSLFCFLDCVVAV